MVSGYDDDDGFFLACEDFGGSFEDSFPACVLFLFCVVFVLEVDFNSRTPISLFFFRPGSVHSGSAS